MGPGESPYQMWPEDFTEASTLRLPANLADLSLPQLKLPKHLHWLVAAHLPRLTRLDSRRTSFYPPLTSIVHLQVRRSQGNRIRGKLCGAGTKADSHLLQDVQAGREAVCEAEQSLLLRDSALVD